MWNLGAEGGDSSGLPWSSVHPRLHSTADLGEATSSGSSLGPGVQMVPQKRHVLFMEAQRNAEGVHTVVHTAQTPRQHSGEPSPSGTDLAVPSVQFLFYLSPHAPASTQGSNFLSCVHPWSTRERTADMRQIPDLVQELNFAHCGSGGCQGGGCICV